CPSQGIVLNIVAPMDSATAALLELAATASRDILFVGDPRVSIDPGPRMFDRMAQVIRDRGAGLVYADSNGHPRIDYQSGSIRDNFDFGPVIAIPAKIVSKLTESRWGGLFELRLRIAETLPIVRIPEPLYGASVLDSRPTGQKQFDYVDPRNRDYQLEMESIATAHLKRIGAWLEPQFEPVPASPEPY